MTLGSGVGFGLIGSWMPPSARCRAIVKDDVETIVFKSLRQWNCQSEIYCVILLRRNWLNGPDVTPRAFNAHLGQGNTWLWELFRSLSYLT